MNQIPKTIFFTTCRGVFAGGGCRAAAHVGAVEAAKEVGINFSEVAGTSAGSLVAALLGAGATPESLRRLCTDMTFAQLLRMPTGGSVDTGAIGRVLRRIPLIRSSLLGKIAAYGGAYSSEEIERWVDQELARLLPTAPRPVKFKALRLPTTIVATDLSSNSLKVWSTRTTPDESVALAVRCSCSIPLFFEPVAAGNSRFVDGGLLSNLPSFVFSHPETSILGGRVLAFSLRDDSQPSTQWNQIQYLSALASTVVGGATQLQTSIQPGINVISIPTGNIRATDFDITPTQVSQLMNGGREAVFEFIRTEAAQLQAGPPRVPWYPDEDSFLADLVEEAHVTGTSLVIAMRDTRWFWNLFPTVLAWIAAGAALKLLVEPVERSIDGRERELQRRSILAALGANISETESLPLQAYLLLRQDDHREAAFIVNPIQTSHASYGTSYSGSHHRPLMAAIKHLLLTGLNQQQDTPRCELIAHPVEEIIEKLKRGVWQYAPSTVTISLEEVPLDRVKMLVRRVRGYKFSQVRYLAGLYQRFSLQSFAPASVMINGNAVSVITPPVIEEWGDDLVAIEGNTRVLLLHKAGQAAIHALVVRGVNEPLPGRPLSPHEALLYARSLTPSERISGWNYDQFRSIEPAVRPFEEE